MELNYEIRTGSDISVAARNALSVPRHLHREIELIYMIEGETEAEIDTKQYLMRAGDVLIAFPNQIHALKDLRENRSFIIIFSPDMCPEYSLILKKKEPVVSCVTAGSRGKEIQSVFKKLIETAERRMAGDTGGFPAQIAKGYLLILLGLTLELFTLTDRKESDTDALKSILIFCNENYTGDLSLDIVAKRLHLNKYYISHLFNKKLKIGFSDYINTLRISDAMHRLAETTDRITEIAYKSGFSSIRSFNRRFLQATGQTPINYRKLRSASLANATGERSAMQ